VEMYFSQLYQRSTREVLEIDQLIVIDTLSMPVLDDPHPTAKWCESEIKLIYKDGDKNEPANFRPISLTSCVGKIYHQILAEKMTLYLSSNGLFNTTVQKAIMRGISGCTNHNLVLQELSSTGAVGLCKERKENVALALHVF
jgi:hypothetical protein